MSERKGKGSRPAGRGTRSRRRKVSLLRRIKHRVKKRLYRHKWLGIAIAVALVILVALGIWVRDLRNRQMSYRIHSQSQIDVGAGYRTTTYEGREYRYNNLVTTILYAGLDSSGDLKATKQYTVAPRADSVMLLVLDEYHKKMTVVALSRDTMTQIHRYTLNGRDRGLYEDHLGYAYTYGDGGEVSCKNLCQAVSDMLGGIPINEYIINNVSALSALGDMIGPVAVTVPNDDLADEGLAKGSVIEVDGSNLETFVRQRDTGEDLSNVGRMERQRAYVKAAMGQLAGSLKDDPTGAWERLLSAERSIRMSITRNRYLDLANAFEKVSFEDDSYYTPEGEQVVGAEHDEFYPDMDRLRARVIELFYLEQ